MAKKQARRIEPTRKSNQQSATQKIIAEKDDLLADAWAIIANAHGGDWELANDDWRKAAERWRDRWHKNVN